MTNITNDAQMSSILNNIVRDVAKAVADKLYQVNREEIEDVVYSYQLDMETSVYARTHQFRDAWKTDIKSATNTHEATLDYKPLETGMQFNPEEWQHGSNYGSPNDVREALAEILYEGISGGLFGDGAFSEPRNAYNALVKKCDKSLDKWIKDELKKHGLTTTPRHLKISGTWE